VAALHEYLMPFETIRFEDFELDQNAFELRRAGQLVKLERIPLQLLFLLAENHDRLVTREEILQAIWGKDVFVDADNSINTAVRKARQALKDDPENPRFLRTVSGKGYRFTATIGTAPPPSLREGPVIPRSHSETPQSRRTPHRLAVWTAVALSLLLIGGLILRSRLNKPTKTASRKTMLVVLPFVNMSGDPHDDYFADGMTEEMNHPTGES
jgi:DNA-binding winged helix-turn-helix (wHTH) protein